MRSIAPRSRLLSAISLALGLLAGWLISTRISPREPGTSPATAVVVAQPVLNEEDRPLAGVPQFSETVGEEPLKFNQLTQPAVGILNTPATGRRLEPGACA